MQIKSNSLKVHYDLQNVQGYIGMGILWPMSVWKAVQIKRLKS